MSPVLPNASVGNVSSELSIDGIVDLLNQDDTELEIDDKTLKGKEKEETDEDEDKDKDKEKEDEPEIKLKEDEEEIDDKVNLVTPFRRKDILKKYPEVFKDFPYLEKAYFRDQQFTELLPTIDDAKSAIEKAEAFDKFESQILSGNIDDVLTVVKEQDSKSFAKMVDNYLPALAKVDQNAYYHVLGNVMKNTIISMVKESRNSKNEALQTAAQILNQFVFGTSEFTKPENLSGDTDDEAKNELQQERAQFIKEAFETKRDDLNHKISNVLKSTVDSHIDPRQSMTDYVRKNAVRDALDSLETLMHQDPKFQPTIDKLWERAFKERFSKNSMDGIRSFYLSKAKTLLPSVIQKARNDALKGLGKRMKDDEEEETDRKGPIARVASTTQRTKKDEIPKNMRTIDFLMQD